MKSCTDVSLSAEASLSFPGMIGALTMSAKLVGIEIDLAQIARCITLSFVIEVTWIRMTAFAAGSYRMRAYAATELDHGDKAVAVIAIPGFVPGLCSERREASEPYLASANGTARLGASSL